jgi:YcxB-like protein
MASSPVSFVVHLKPGDLYRLQFWFMLRGSRSIWIFPILLALITAPVVATNVREQEPLASNLSPMIGLVGLWVVLLLIIPCFVIRRRFRSDKSLHEDTCYTFSEDRIDIESATASSRVDWARIDRAVETKSYFYLFTAKRPTYIIPKRCFSVGTQITELQNILRNAVKGKVRLLS